MFKPLILGALVGLAAPALAEDFDAAAAESRLRGCLLAGSTATGQETLQGAVIAARAFCGAQIKRVRDQRVAAATEGLGGSEARDAEDKTVRALNSEIALAVSNFSGLKP